MRQSTMRIHQYGNAPRDNNLKNTLFIMFIVNQLNLMERKTSLIIHYFEIFLVDTTDGNGYSSEVEDQLAVTVYTDDVAFTSLEEACEDTQPYMVLGKSLKRFTQKGDFLGMPDGWNSPCQECSQFRRRDLSHSGLRFRRPHLRGYSPAGHPRLL